MAGGGSARLCFCSSEPSGTAAGSTQWPISRREVGGRSSLKCSTSCSTRWGRCIKSPERLLLEEIPSALDLRPLLDVIGAGCHRVSEIAGRLGRQATSMSRSLERLLGMGLIRREVPFGESAKESRRSLYKMEDPFFRLWFRIVAPHRAQLTAGTRETREQLLSQYWDELVAHAFEELCRRLVAQLGRWKVASRWWQGNAPEWDFVAETLDGEGLLLGEVKWSQRPMSRAAIEKAKRELTARPAPALGAKWDRLEKQRALFVPALADPHEESGEIVVLTLKDLLTQGGALSSNFESTHRPRTF